MAGVVDPNGLRAQALDNQEIPDEGGKSLAVFLDFSAQDTFGLDVSLLMQRGIISMLQTLFVDMSNTDQPLQIFFEGSRQTITCKGRTQGYYSVLAPNPVKMTLRCPGGPLGLQLYLINVPIPGVVWPTQ
jgi:hypothetical protein